MSHGVEITRVDNGVATKVEVTELPIRWVPEYAIEYDTHGENETQWSMFIPQVVDGQEIGGVSFDIVVTKSGLLHGMGVPLKFATPEEAKRYAEATFNLQEANDAA